MQILSSSKHPESVLTQTYITTCVTRQYDLTLDWHCCLQCKKRACSYSVKIINTITYVDFESYINMVMYHTQLKSSHIITCIHTYCIHPWHSKTLIILNTEFSCGFYMNKTVCAMYHVCHGHLQDWHQLMQLYLSYLTCRAYRRMEKLQREC